MEMGYLAVGNVKYFSENGIGDGYAKYELWLNQLTQTGYKLQRNI